MGEQLMLFDKHEFKSERLTYEYFFLISPPEIIKNAIKELKKKLNAQVNLSIENLHSIAHISLFKCLINSKNEKYVMLITDAVLRGVNAFNIKLNGHLIFEHGSTRSLVIKIDEAEQINKINNMLAKGFKVKNFEITPHITIARSLKINDINKISDNLSEYNFEGEFFCTEITILRKEAGSQDKYVIFHKMLLS